MENNPNPTPAPSVAPEAPAAPVPEVAPTPEPAPTQEPAPTPVAPAVPDVPETPAEPISTEAQAANPVVPAQPKKKLSKGILAAIITGAVVLLGGLGFLAFVMFGKDPTALANSAFQNAFSEKTFAYKAAAEATSSEQTMTYSTEMVALENGEAYFRIEGLGQLFGALLSAFSSSSTLDSVALDAAFEQVEATWWKLEPGEDTSDLGVANIDTTNLAFAERQKIVTALKANPFLIAEKTTIKDYSTSGDAYKITFDKDKLAAYKNAMNGNADNLSISGLAIEDYSEIPIYITMTSPLFSDPVLTGIYIESASNDTTSKIAIDFEHCQKTAPAEFRNVSEMATMIQEAFGEFAPITDNDDGHAAARDTARRNDYATLAANITLYITNNNGKLPAVGTLDATKYINATGTDPSDYPYALEVVDYAEEYSMGWGVNEGDTTNVYVVLHATCDADHQLTDSEGSRDFAIAGSLESGDYYCQSN